MRYFLKLRYKGTKYHGWQIQKNAKTVQEALNHCLTLQLGTPINCIGCGRTDTGVHARTFYAHFDFDGELSPVFLPKLNSFLPKDIAIQAVYTASDPNAHARWSALERTYRYVIVLGKDPLLLEYAAFIYRQLDVAKMNEAAALLKNYSNFEAFSKYTEEETHHLSTISHAAWKQWDDILVFKITANRFLRGMVRILVGSMLEIGKGKLTVSEFQNILETRDRSRAGAAAPAEGLYLWDVKYPEGMMEVVKNEK